MGPTAPESSSPLPEAAQILQVSDDSTLAASRAKVLEAATGCHVFTVSSHAALPELLRQPVHMVLLCTSVGPQVAADLASTVRRTVPSAAVIRLSLHTELTALYDSLLEAPVMPQQLQATVQHFSCR